MSSERWKPVLSGDVYCSPGCGAGCTKAAHDTAASDALKLATDLGEGWEPHVWENFGWHYRAFRDEAAIYPSTEGGYRCFFNGVSQFIHDGNTPREALEGALADAQEFVDTLQFQIKGAQR